MKINLLHALLCTSLSCALATVGAAQGIRGKRGVPLAGNAATTVSGTITQFNYDRDAEVEGFLLSNNALVHLPPPIAAHLAGALHAGDNIQVTGLAQASPAGVTTIEAQVVQDRTSDKTLKVPQSEAPAPYSGSGRIRQLNYGPDGAINGFLLDHDTLATMAPFAASNPSSVRVGATVAYSGYARNTLSGRTVVDMYSLTINGQTLTVAMAAPSRSAGARPPAPPIAPPPATRATAPVAPQPDGRTDEPPPPPPPGQPQRP